MRKQNAASLVLDPTHCRAICDEIGERLRSVMKPAISDIPSRLLELIARLAEQETADLTQLEFAPSIAPSIDEMALPASFAALAG